MLKNNKIWFLFTFLFFVLLFLFIILHYCFNFNNDDVNLDIEWGIVSVIVSNSNVKNITWISYYNWWSIWNAFFVDTGILLTSKHVVKWYNNVYVNFDWNLYVVDDIVFDDFQDIAMLRINKNIKWYNVLKVSDSYFFWRWISWLKVKTNYIVSNDYFNSSWVILFSGNFISWFVLQEWSSWSPVFDSDNYVIWLNIAYFLWNRKISLFSFIDKTFILKLKKKLFLWYVN